MILLDTNIVSDVLKIKPNPKLQEWLNSHHPELLWISSISVAELQIGIELMDDGKRKENVRTGIDRAIAKFGARCAPFDALAAYDYARIVTIRHRVGRPIDAHDAQIAAIALSGGFSLATFNRRDFDGIEGLKVIDPTA
jgi:toxin FitB